MVGYPIQAAIRLALSCETSLQDLLKSVMSVSQYRLVGVVSRGSVGQPLARRASGPGNDKSCSDVDILGVIGGSSVYWTILFSWLAGSKA